jgi:hypothetical protein
MKILPLTADDFFLEQLQIVDHRRAVAPALVVLVSIVVTTHG